ncbi:MAG TPA: GNAT family N-acetyltransferase [Fimbriimonadaceae bacterium]|nr:GNAT family N-acetyltransferase [Fimbriimonadaceae bacterium]
MSVVRQLNSEDAAAFHALRLRGLQEEPTSFGSAYEEEVGYSKEKVEDWLSGSPVFGVFEVGSLVALTGLWFEKELKHRHKAGIWGVYVAPENRGKGFASLAMQAAINHAFARPEIRQVVLAVNATNVSAIRLYERFGFVPYGLEPGFILVDDELHDELHMILRRPTVASPQGEITYVNHGHHLRPENLEGFFVGWPNPPSPQTHLRLLNQSDVVWVAMDGERCVGFVNALSDGVLYGFVPLLEVLPPYQGRGIGSVLMRRMLDSLRGRYAVDLVCDKSLEPFYEQFGMRGGSSMMLRRYERQSG